MDRTIPEDTPRTLLVALATWALATVVASVDGVFAKLSEAELGAIALFAFAFATLTVRIDPALRGFLRAVRTRSYVAFVLQVDAGIAVVTGLALGIASGDAGSALARFPLAVVVVFALPVAGVAHLLLAERLLGRGSAGALSRPAARAPGERPVAT